MSVIKEIPKENYLLSTGSDMGSIRLFSKSGAFFFSNGMGDGRNDVRIFEDLYQDYAQDPLSFLQSFEVEDEVFLSLDDCSNKPIYQFKKGRWFVYLREPMSFAFFFQGDVLDKFPEKLINRERNNE